MEEKERVRDKGKERHWQLFKAKRKREAERKIM